MRTIKIPAFDITIELDNGGGSISSNLSEIGDDCTEYNASMDGIESMILAHAIAGIDVESPEYIDLTSLDLSGTI